MNVESTVYEIIREQMQNDDLHLARTTNFKNDLGFDSLDLVEVELAVEQQFGLDLPNDSLAELETVGEAVIFIQQKMLKKEYVEGCEKREQERVKKPLVIRFQTETGAWYDDFDQLVEPRRISGIEVNGMYFAAMRIRK